MGNRRVLSLIAVMAHRGAHAPAAGSTTCLRFDATRQRPEQNRACSQRGANTMLHLEMNAK